MTQPRAGLYAALITRNTGEVVRRAIGERCYNALEFSDSQIVHHLISNENRLLKKYVCNNH